MAIRVTDTDVRAILDSDLESQIPSMVPFIRAANILADRVEECAISRNRELTSNDLLEIERWIAAHYAVHKAPQFKSKSTQSASGSWDTLRYIDTAKNFDSSGCLAAILDGRRASGTWLGKPHSKQIPYSQRS